MGQPVINVLGEKVALGPLDRTLLPLLHRWHNDFEVMRNVLAAALFDWRLADALESGGVEVVRVWVWAPKEETLARLRARTGRKVPVSEAERIYDAACANAASRRFDLRLDTTGELQPHGLADALSALLARTRRSKHHA
jgi:hypothetical protein